MILYINTTQADKVIFGIKADRKIIKKTFKLNHQESYLMIGKLDEFLRKAKTLNPKSEIKKIIVNKGPGSFVGIRVGAAIALALGFAWKIPVGFLNIADFSQITTLKKR